MQIYILLKTKIFTIKNCVTISELCNLYGNGMMWLQ
jgi:hypothetical protein